MANAGIYHNVFNKEGSRKVSDGRFWYNTTVDLVSRADCFNPTKWLAASGYVSSGVSGAPDGVYYDKVVNANLKDARISAKEPTDKVQLLTDTMSDLVDGFVRGTELINQMVLANKNPTSAGTTTRINYTGIDSYAVVGDVVHVLQSGVPYKAYISAVSADYIDFDSRTYPAPAATATTDTFIISGGRVVSSAGIRRCCTLIGDPANYYRGSYDFLSSDGVQTFVTGDVIKVVDGYLGHQTNGGIAGHYYKRTGLGASVDLGLVSYQIAFEDLGPDREDSWLLEGNTLDAKPLLVAEDGSSLIPDGASKLYQLSDYASTTHKWLYSFDNGNTWPDNTVNFSVWGTGALTFPLQSGRLDLVFYTSPTAPLIDYETPDSVISEGTTVIASDSSRLVDYVTGKVAVGTSDNEECTVLKRVNGVWTHTASDLTEGAKVTGSLVELNDKYYIKVASEEIDTVDDGAIDSDDGTHLVPLPYFVGGA